jgi:hypothetical protein
MVGSFAHAMDTGNNQVIKRNSSAESIEIDLEKGHLSIPVSMVDHLSSPPPSQSASTLQNNDTTTSPYKTIIMTGLASLVTGGVSAIITYFSSKSGMSNSTSCPPPLQ